MAADEPLITDEELKALWAECGWMGKMRFITETQMVSDRNTVSRRIEALVRKRLAERLSIEITQEKRLATIWEQQIKAGDRESITGFNRSQRRISDLEEAARIVEGADD